MIAASSAPARRAASSAGLRAQDATSYHACQAMLRGLRRHRPPLAGIGYGLAARWDGEAGATDPAEYRVASRMAPGRRREFMLGRRALHRALADAGLPGTPILIDDRNRPRFPPGMMGSLSHAGGLAVALAGSTTRFRTVGVDLELTPLPLQAAHLVLADQEHDRAMAGSELALLAAFSAKEAAFKALDPILDGSAPPPRHILLRRIPVGFLAWPAARPELMLRVNVHHVGTGVLAWTAWPLTRPNHHPHTEKRRP
jgi:4'-phosphopantetheinyl transferase EntD